MKWSEGGEVQFENPEPGSHLARCYSLVDLGTQTSYWEGKEVRRRKVRISFELPYSKMEGTHNADLKGKPFSAHIQCTQTLDRRGNLRQMLEGWRGKRFEQHELEAYDPKNLLGVPARINLVENDKGYINIDSISRVTRQEQDNLPELTIDTVYVSLEPEEFDQAEFEKLTEKTQQKLMLTPEWAKLQDGLEREMESEQESRQVPDGDYENIPFLWLAALLLPVGFGMV